MITNINEFYSVAESKDLMKSLFSDLLANCDEKTAVNILCDCINETIGVNINVDLDAIDYSEKRKIYHGAKFEIFVPESVFEY